MSTPGISGAQYDEFAAVLCQRSSGSLAWVDANVCNARRKKLGLNAAVVLPLLVPKWSGRGESACANRCFLTSLDYRARPGQRGHGGAQEGLPLWKLLL